MGIDLRTRRSGRGMEGERAGRKEAGSVRSRDGGGAIHKNEGGVRGGFSGDLRKREGGQGVRDPNAIEVDRGWGGDRRCFNCGMFGHMARHCRN